MNIFIIVGAIASALLGDISNLQSLISTKNWSGLTTNILGLVESVLSTMFAASKNGEAVPQQHLDAAIAKISGHPVGTTAS